MCGVSTEDVERAVAASGENLALVLLDEVEGEGLRYRIERRGEDGAALSALVDAPVTLLSGRCRNGSWTLRLRAVGHEPIAAFQVACESAGIPLTLSRLGPLAAADGDGGSDPTTAQLEALELAYRRGYFDDARTATLDELAGELDISRQALAGRLRRGHRTLLGRLFATGADGALLETLVTGAREPE